MASLTLNQRKHNRNKDMKKTEFTLEQRMKINGMATDIASIAVHFMKENPEYLWTDACHSTNRLRAEAIRTAEELLSTMGYKTLMSSKRAAGGGYFLVLTAQVKAEDLPLEK